MQPKTYIISLRRPFKAEATAPYRFHLHVPSSADALEWVARVFAGVDVETTRRRWAEPRPPVPRVGCLDQVSVQDCDNLRSRKRVNGRFVALPVVPGEFRCSAHQVANDLREVLAKLLEDRAGMVRAFEHLDACYSRDGLPSQREQLAALLADIERALTWQKNLWLEYLRAQQALSFELPAEREPTTTADDEAAA